MNPKALHLLLTYQCTLQCDHCFVWGSPWQTGTMTRDHITHRSLTPASSAMRPAALRTRFPGVLRPDQVYGGAASE